MITSDEKKVVKALNDIDNFIHDVCLNKHRLVIDVRDSEYKPLNNVQYQHSYGYDEDVLKFDININDIIHFINQQEELTTLVKRYFELDGNYQKSSHEYHEMEYIKNKINEMVGIK